MLKLSAALLTSMFLMVGSDYAGQHGLSIWLGIPLTIAYVALLAVVIRGLFRR